MIEKLSHIEIANGCASPSLRLPIYVNLKPFLRQLS